MNSKKCKALRRQVRQEGLDPTEARYNIRRVVKTLETPKGSIRIPRDTHILDPKSGRGRYKELKRCHDS